MNLLEVKERIMAYESIKSNLPEMKYKTKQDQTIDFFLSNFPNIKGEKLDKLKSLLKDFLKRMASDSYYYCNEELYVSFIFQDEKYLDFIPNDYDCFESLLRFLIEIKGTKNLEWMNLDKYTFIPFITMMNKMYNHPSEKAVIVNKLKKLHELDKISNDFSKIEAAMIFNKVIDIENHLDLLEYADLEFFNGVKNITETFTRLDSLERMNFFKSNIEKIKDYDWKKLIDLGTFLFLSLFEIEKTISISSKLESLINNEEDKAFFKRFISANVLAFERLSEKEIYSLSYKVINEEFEVLDSHELDDFLKALYPLKKELIDKATYHGFLNLLHFYLKNKKKNQLNIIEENLSDDDFISRLSWLDSYKMFDKIIFESYAHFMDESFNFSSRKVFSIFNSLNSELPIRFDIFKKAASLNTSWYSYTKKISLTQVENLKSVSDEIFNYSKWTIYLEKNIEDILKMASMYSCLDLQNRFRINKDSASILILLGEKVFDEIINYQINDTYLSLLKFYLVDLGNEITLDKNGLIESILKDKSFSKSLESLSISKDFLFDNKDEFSKLLVKDIAKIINTFAKDYSFSKKVAFSKILKAQIAGKFDELKFYKGDLAKEIGKDISKEQELIWKENKQLRMKNIEIKETYDFLTTINIGVYPTKTCMHYEHGAYRSALLSNFDSNKKIMTAYKDGKLVARAILRLTTGSKGSINQGLEFVDVTTENANSKTKENLLLFLERGYYSNINEEEKDFIFKKFVELSYLKAKEIGAKFSGADCYNSFLLKYPIYHKGYFYVTITKSKNETQYLDSFGGESVASDLTQARSSLIILE